nr:iron-sulfur cluster assembly protein [Rhodococcus wratislaviensis]GLK33561.1 hypothetical protein GCM10017611_04030 [Rhodococcus wratislaviensis]
MTTGMFFGDVQRPDESRFDPDLARTLHSIADPCSIATGVPIDLIDMGLVLAADRDGGIARIRMQLTSNVCMQLGIMEAKIRAEVGALPWVEDVEVDIDYAAEWLPEMVAERAQSALRDRRPFPLTVVEH